MAQTLTIAQQTLQRRPALLRHALALWASHVAMRARATHAVRSAPRRRTSFALRRWRCRCTQHRRTMKAALALNVWRVARSLRAWAASLPSLCTQHRIVEAEAHACLARYRRALGAAILAWLSFASAARLALNIKSTSATVWVLRRTTALFLLWQGRCARQRAMGEMARWSADNRRRRDVSRALTDWYTATTGKRLKSARASARGILLHHLSLIHI